MTKLIDLKDSYFRVGWGNLRLPVASRGIRSESARFIAADADQRCLNRDDKCIHLEA